MKFFFDEVQDLAIEFSARYAGCYAARGTKVTTTLRMRENMRAKNPSAGNEKAYWWIQLAIREKATFRVHISPLSSNVELSGKYGKYMQLII